MAAEKRAKPESPRSSARFEKRCRAVESIREGESPTVVARVLGAPPRSVFHWVSRYRHGGYDALTEGRRSGRPRKVSGEVMRGLYQAITLGDPRQYPFAFCLWPLAIIRQLRKREFALELSKSGVRRLLQQWGLSPQRPSSGATSGILKNCGNTGTSSSRACGRKPAGGERSATSGTRRRSARTPIAAPPGGRSAKHPRAPIVGIDSASNSLARGAPEGI